MKNKLLRAVILVTVMLFLLAGVAQARVDEYAGVAGAGYKDGKLKEAKFLEPYGMIYADGKLFVADYGNNLIRVIENGEVKTFAGSVKLRDLGGVPVGGHSDGRKESALFNGPRDIAIDAEGSLYIADTKNHSIRKIKDGRVTTFAGNGKPGYKDGQGIAAQLRGPSSLCFDADGNLYVADTLNHLIRVIDPDGNVETYTGKPGERGGFRDGELAVAEFYEPTKVRMDNDGELLVLDAGNQRLRVIYDGKVETVSGGAISKDSEGYFEAGFADGSAREARFNFPKGFFVSENGVIFIADTWNNRIRAIKTDGSVVTLIGSGDPGEAIGPASGNVLHGPADVIYVDGKLYISDMWNHAIKVAKVDINTLALEGGTEGKEREVKVYINNRLVTFPDTKPTIENGRTILPLRAITEAMGAEINWLTDGRKVEIKSDGKTLHYTMEKDPMEIRGDRVVVQIRFLIERLGYQVDWDGITKSVIIVK